LLDYLLPVFREETGWEVDTIAVGTGAAIMMGRDGDADVILCHSREDEIKLVEDGFGVRRYDVMHNDFLVVGPDLKQITHNDKAVRTFREIASKKLLFVSRGDNSGTHKMELRLWKSAGIDPEKLVGYISTGQGMGAVLLMACELRAYTLTDRATWLAFSRGKKIDMCAVCEDSRELLNSYGVIPVNPVAFSAAKKARINREGGEAFADWLLKGSTQALIGQYGIAEYGVPFFTPNGKKY
jgi:tungstate transport system substrate-binding protein